MKKMKKMILTVTLCLVLVLVCFVLVPYVTLVIRTSSLKSDYTYLTTSEEWKENNQITGIPLVTQKESCGYAVIEMMSSYYGEKVTEEELKEKNNNKITTSTTDGFLKEVNSTLSARQFEKKTYCKNDELLKAIYLSLEKGNPVAFEWAAKKENDWTLHFSLVVGLDFSSSEITVLNPYGYKEILSLEEFIERTSFKSFTSMPLFYTFGFMYGAFSKNTIFVAK